MQIRRAMNLLGTVLCAIMQCCRRYMQLHCMMTTHNSHSHKCRTRANIIHTQTKSQALNASSSKVCDAPMRALLGLLYTLTAREHPCTVTCSSQPSTAPFCTGKGGNGHYRACRVTTSHQNSIFRSYSDFFRFPVSRPQISRKISDSTGKKLDREWGSLDPEEPPCGHRMFKRCPSCPRAH